MREHADDGLLDAVDEVAHTDALAAQVDQRIGDDLAGAVIGHLAAAVDPDHRDVARRQQVLGLAGLPLGEHRRVLHQPKLVAGVSVAVVGEGLHCAPNRLIVGQAQAAQTQLA